MKFGSAEEFVVAWQFSATFGDLRANLRRLWGGAPKVKSLVARARRYRQMGVRLKPLGY